MNNRGKRVLVIEDDHHLRDLLEIVLELDEDIGAVVTLDDERRAVEVCRAYQPDVVVLDEKLPHRSGEEVAADLRSEKPELRIISMSGFERSERPWADHQIVKSRDFLPDLRRALASESDDAEQTLDLR